MDYDGYSPSDKDIVIGRYRLVLTSMACPEQYDVFDEITKKQAGYLRLRHGYFRADLDHCGGETVYEADTRGDGIFDEEERMPELIAAIDALENAIVARERGTSER
jgi:hypothetical protein